MYQKAGEGRKRELSRQAWGFCCSPVANSAEETLGDVHARRHLVVSHFISLLFECNVSAQFVGNKCLTGSHDNEILSSNKSFSQPRGFNTV